MSTTAPSPAFKDSSPLGGRVPAGARGARRWPVVALLVAALVASGAVQQFNQDRRAALVSRTGSTATVSNLNSYTLALLLGGLRGPLVMFLWPSSENQKQERDLEDLDTKIELIRLLQPEYDSVLLFQIWNKAYNISVLMSSNRNKYAAVVDALDFAHKCDDQKPDDINLVASFADLYFNKLGGSSEQDYYTQQVLKDTVWREPARAGGGAGGDAVVRKTRIDPMLDRAGRILPALLKPRVAYPAHGVVYDGSELQFLQRFEPFPYGLSPLGLGYNYYQRAEMLSNATHQRHLQLSDQVMDSRPAVSLKGWAEGEYNQAMRLEMQAWGQGLREDALANRGIVARPTQSEPPALPPSPAALPGGAAGDASAPPRAPADVLAEAAWHLEMVGRVRDRAEEEYTRHLATRKNNAITYRTHRDELAALSAIAAADRLFLRAILTDAPASDAPAADAPKDAPPATAPAPIAAKADLLRQARAAYQQASAEWWKMLLRHGIRDDAAAAHFPPGYTRENIDAWVDQRLAADRQQGGHRGADEVAALVETLRGLAYKSDELLEYSYYIDRAKARIGTIDAALPASPRPATTTPKD